MATHSSILAWRFLWTEEPGGLSSTGSQRVGHDWSDMACTQWKKVFLGNWCSTVFSRENWGLLATFCSTPPHSCFCPVGGKFSQEHNTRWCCCIYAKPAAGPATEAVCRFHLESVKYLLNMKLMLWKMTYSVLQIGTMPSTRGCQCPMPSPFHLSNVMTIWMLCS